MDLLLGSSKVFCNDLYITNLHFLLVMGTSAQPRLCIIGSVTIVLLCSRYLPHLFVTLERSI